MFAQSASWDTVIIPSTISLGGKFQVEIGIHDLPLKDTSNKEYYFFDPDYIDLSARLIAPSGKEYVIDGFYSGGDFIPSTPLLSNSYTTPVPSGGTTCPGWENSLRPTVLPPCYNYNGEDFGYFAFETAPPAKVLNSAGWKIRFTPLETGQWKLFITLKYRSDLSQPFVSLNYPSVSPLDTNLFYKFECITSQTDGYIRVAANGRYLQYEKGKDIFPIGENLYFGYTRCKQDLNGGSVKMKKFIDELTENGGNYFNFMSFARYERGGLQVNEAGMLRRDYSKSRTFDLDLINAFRYDDIIDYAQQKGVVLKFPLLQGTWLDNWANNPFNVSQTDKPCACLSYTGVLSEENKSYLNYLRYVIARWGYATNVVAWEIFDEPESIYPFCTDLSKVVAWFNQTHLYVKSKDYNRHLIAVCFGVNPEYEPAPGVSLVNVARSSLVDILSDNGGMYFHDPTSQKNRCNTISGAPNFFSNDAVVHIGDDDVFMNYHRNPWNMDEVYFSRMDKASSFNKPYFKNSFWIDNTWRMTELDELKYAFFHHNAYWMSLVSGTCTTASPWDGPHYVHCPFQVGTEKKMFVLQQFKPIRQFSDMIKRSEFPLDRISTNLWEGKSATGSDPLYITDSQTDKVTNDLRCMAVRDEAGKTKFYGWIQDKNYELYNLYHLNPVTHDNFNYTITLDASYKPPLITGRNLNLRVLYKGIYRISVFNIYADSIYRDSSLSKDIVAVNGRLSVPLGKFDGLYGDKCFLVELIGSPTGGIFTNEEISWYPNPTRNEIVAETNNSELNLDDFISVNAVNISGIETNLNVTLVNTKIVMDCNGLRPGLYFVVINTRNNRRFTRKILIE